MIYLSIFFVLLTGFFKACQDARKDFPYGKLFDIMNDWDLMEWYTGGNEKYNPSILWKADFWHFCDTMRDYSWALAALFLLFTLNEWMLIPFVVAVMLKSWVFVWFYRYVFYSNPPGDFWHFLKYRILFFKPWRGRT